MKKLSVFLCFALLLSALTVVAVVPAGAEVTGEAPDWVITEISNDTSGTDLGYTNGYVTGADVFEFIEIYNNSDKTLNLYDYAVTYNGNKRSSEKFEAVIVESTPIKAGDYLDGSTLVPTDDTAYGDLSNKPVNPATCEVAPGEVVVLWMIFYEAYYDVYNEGKGISLADFRAHWNVPEDVKVIAVDSCTTAAKGGHDKNFNVKNKDVGTYGIAKQSEELNTASNVDGASGLAVSYTEYDGLACWATVDFIDQIIDGSKANLTYNFTWDFGGYAADDQIHSHQHDDIPYEYDARRGFMLSLCDEPTVGRLNPLQKMTMGVALEAGESIEFDPNVIYYPFLEENIYGFIIDGKMYKDFDTFTAEEAGVYDYDFSFVKELPTETEAPTEAPTEPVTEKQTEAPTEAPTETPTEEQTAAPTEEATEVPTSATTEAATKAETLAATDTPKETKGCGSLLAFSLPILLFPAVLVMRKRED